MNLNPLLIKSSLTGKIPFMKNKTLSLYGKYISNNILSKVLKESTFQGELKSETISAYTLNSAYEVDFTFDEVDITNSDSFSQKEWIALGMLLRAYKEVENINLLHLYNCLYRANNKTVYGNLVSGRMYTLYGYTQIPVILRFKSSEADEPFEIKLKSLNGLNPYIFRCPYYSEDGWNSESGLESLIEIEIEFSGYSYRPCTLLEGKFGTLLDGVGKRSYEPKIETDEVKIFNKGPINSLVPEFLGIGEYSSRLVEFFSGTLITGLSNSKLRSEANSKINDYTLPKFCNKDGFIGKEVQW